MASSARSFFISRATDLSIKRIRSPPFSHQLLLRPFVPALTSRFRSSAVVSCLISGVDGGGVSDDFVSTRKSGFGREFAVIANMLRKIEPLDTSVISQGVSDTAKDSMKQTISSMLGLLPSDQFSVTIRASKQPLYRLLKSSIITGYTLWNAEYRVSLMHNFDIPTDDWDRLGVEKGNLNVEVERQQCESEGGADNINNCSKDMEKLNLQNLGQLSPESLSYIRHLELELSTAKQELDAKKLDNMQMERTRGRNNDLLEYLRSLDSVMVTELSQPSSIEVEEITHHLVQNILRIFFKDDPSSEFEGESATRKESTQNDDVESSSTVCASRDYLAKLLFWCMLLGHHLRGLENRLHLSCVVGLL